MSRVLPLSLTMLMLSVTPVWADEITADSALTAATVYSDRAMLTRRAVVEVPAGKHMVVFEDLPANLLPESLRAEGTAVADVTFGALSNRIVQSAELTQERERAINAQIETVGDQIAATNGEKQALAAKQAFLDNLSKQAALRTGEEIAQIDLKPDQWKGAADAVQVGIGEVIAGQQAADIKLRGLQKEMAKLQAELQDVYTGARNAYQVVLPVEVESATKLTVEVSYQVPDATWQPLYDARLDTEGGTLALVQYGSVQQSTGEDWTGVALTLSTAQPQRGASLPEPEPQWVSLFDPNMRAQKAGRGFAGRSVATMAESGIASAEMAMPAPMAAMDMANAAPVMKEARFVTAEIDTGGFVAEYKIPGPSTVKSDGTESKVMIAPFEIDGKVQLRVRPQVSTEAYLAAQATLKGERPVLPGMVSLFRDDAFVGQAELPLLRPGKEQTLYFGVDDQVAVKRDMLKDERSQAGIVARDQVIERHAVTSIQNLHSRAFDVVVEEVVPTSQDEKARVEIISAATTPGYTKDAENIKGLLRWQFTMEPQEKKDVKTGVKVSWPAEMELQGY